MLRTWCQRRVELIKHAKDSTKGYYALGVTTFLWSSACVAIRVGLRGYTPVALGFLRYLVASIVILPIYLSLRKKRLPTFKHFFFLFLTGAVGIGVYNIALNTGEQEVSAATAGFVVSTIPVWATVFAVAFLKEKVPFRVWLGIGIAMLGTLLIFIVGSSIHHGVDFKVISLALASVCGAINTIGQKLLLKRFDPLEIVSWCIGSGTVFMSFSAYQAFHEVMVAPLSATWAVVYLGIFPGVLAYVSWCYALRVLLVNQAAVALYLMPVITTLLGWVVLSELPSGMFILGGILIVMGVIVCIWSKSTNKPIRSKA